MTTVEWIESAESDRRESVFKRLAEISREIEEKKLWWIRNTGVTPTCVYLREADYTWLMQNMETILGSSPVMSTTTICRFLGLKMFVSDQLGSYVDAREDT